MDISEFFRANNKAALAFSGGTDSAYLLAAAKAAGADIKAYYVRSLFQPGFQLEDAEKLCRQLGAELEIIDIDVLSCEKIRSNPADRCYHCKRKLLSAIKERAERDGYSVIIEGTNASDSFDDRPGMRAVEELGILSPLRACALTKPEIRRLSAELGLFTWNIPAYSCLATRIASGEELSAEKLSAVEESENYIKSLGFSDFRVRMCGRTALLQFTSEQLTAANEKAETIKAGLSDYFDEINFDPKARTKSL